METKLQCKNCGGTSFYRTGGQLHSDPPWDIFGCHACLSLWAVNCRDIYRFEEDQVIYREGSVVRNEGKPIEFVSTDGKVRLGWPPGTDKPADYGRYRKYNRTKAVGVYGEWSD